MSNYKLRPYNEEDKEKALKLYAERITYSPRYSSKSDACTSTIHIRWSSADIKARGIHMNTGKPILTLIAVLADDRHVHVSPAKSTSGRNYT